MHENRTLQQMESYLEQIQDSPANEGAVAMIVSRPDTNKRRVLKQAELHDEQGLVGDNWLARGNRHMPDGRADPKCQLTLMNSRVIDAICGDKARWPEAGDQFFVDFDLSTENLPPGTHLGIGEAVVEVTDEPHLGCKKFSERFGKDATAFVNSVGGKSLNLRGVNARVIKSGAVAVGDGVKKL